MPVLGFEQAVQEGIACWIESDEGCVPMVKSARKRTKDAEDVTERFEAARQNRQRCADACKRAL